MTTESPITPDHEMLREACGHLAGVLQVGLTTYAAGLDALAVYVADGGGEEQRQVLEALGRNVGLDIIAMSRVADALRDAWRGAPAELDARVALPLAVALGESYALFLLVDSVEVAERLPLVSMERTRELFTPSVRAWMQHHVDEVPEFHAASEDVGA